MSKTPLFVQNPIFQLCVTAQLALARKDQRKRKAVWDLFGNLMAKRKADPEFYTTEKMVDDFIDGAMEIESAFKKEGF